MKLKSLAGKVLYALVTLIWFPALYMFSYMLLTVIPEHRIKSSHVSTAAH